MQPAMNPSLAALAALMLTGTATAAAPNDNQQVRAFFAKHCQECHTGEEPEGEFHLDQLTSNLDDKKVQERWRAALEQIKAGNMPPEQKPRPADVDVALIDDWLRRQTAAAELARRQSQGRVVVRRLNRAEYENTIRDLLGIEIELRESLPLDSSADGFDNVGSALHVSSFALERYLEAADKALSLAIVNRPAAPPRIEKRYSLKNQHPLRAKTQNVFRRLDDDTVVMFSSSPWTAANLTEFYPRDRGLYRVRISASGVQSQGKPVTFRVTNGELRGKDGLIGYFDAPPETPAVVEFTRHFEPRTTFSILPYGLAHANTVDKVGAEMWDEAGLAVQYVEVEGPLNENWPAASHRRIFGDLPQATAPRDKFGPRVEVTSTAPLADAADILVRFARRAFRRAVGEADIQPYLALVKSRLDDKYSFEQAVRVGLLGILVSPDFLYLREEPGQLDDFALASRLSYFLWSSLPDDELLTLAEQSKLRQPAVLRDQVERLLKSPKAAAFTENFVGQWLNLREIDATEPSYLLYPEFDHMLKVSMLREIELFFEEVLKDNLSLTNFVASDFTMLNGRLAKHYGIAGPDGWHFEKVSLPPGSPRGGLLTMAGVLKVTANGTYTHPVHRGVWVLERILGRRPPPPPAGAGAIEPDIRGAKTMRELLAKHRVGSCAACHQKIDPPGFALESFDVIGGYRENYRVRGSGTPVTIDGRRMPYNDGLKVDCADELPDGEKFANIQEFKRLLLRDTDQLARVLTAKLLTYGTGGAPEAGDQAEIEAIVGQTKAKNYGFRALIHEIVQSKVFRTK